MSKEGSNVLRSAAFSEIFLIVLSTVAISFIIGQTNIVSAASSNSPFRGYKLPGQDRVQIQPNDPSYSIPSGVSKDDIYYFSSQEQASIWIDSANAELARGVPISAPKDSAEIAQIQQQEATTNIGPATQTNPAAALGGAVQAASLLSTKRPIPAGTATNIYSTTKPLQVGSSTIPAGTTLKHTDAGLIDSKGTLYPVDKATTLKAVESGDLDFVPKSQVSDYQNKHFNQDAPTLSSIKSFDDIKGKPGFENVADVRVTDSGTQLLDKDGKVIEAYDSKGVAIASAVGTSEYQGSLFGLIDVPGFFLGHLADGLTWSLLVVGAVQLLVPLFGGDSKLTNAISAAAFAGIMGGQAIYGLFGKGAGTLGNQGILTQTLTGPQAALIGVGIAAVVFVLLYKKEKQKVVTLQCLPWEAPLGGADCEKCNQDPLKPCSEYRCKSLGQACDIVNKGTTQERCVWIARNDVKSPLITPWKEVLSEKHVYTDMRGRPPSRGTQIKYSQSTDGCIQPFTALEFGLRTDEPSQCKIDIISNKTFDEMQFYFGESNLFAYNHTEKLRLPSPDSVTAESPELPSEGLYNFYVRCRDANGNVNEDEFVFNMCVDKSPDSTPPVIESTSITSGSAVTFGVQNTTLSLFVNEPSECKWSKQDKGFDLMENNMSCSSHVYQQNAQQLYPCTTTLGGIKDKEDNAFFFRCKDQPLKPENERNTNQESYAFTLKGTQSLSILAVGPNSTITGSTSIVQVNLTATTDDGADEGKATCYFSPTGKEGDYVTMFETNDWKHKQILSLPSGSYTYFFRCIDAGGNLDQKNTSFTILTDRSAPQVTRVYKESDALKLVTNEDAQCSYSLSSCNFVFEEGINMLLLNSQERGVHATPWKPQQSYFIKCRDDWGNEPSPNACSIVVGASTLT